MAVYAAARQKLSRYSPGVRAWCEAVRFALRPCRKALNSLELLEAPGQKAGPAQADFAPAYVERPQLGDRRRRPFVAIMRGCDNFARTNVVVLVRRGG